MNIYSDLIKNKQFNNQIESELQKHSQEYRVLATLRYLFPQKYRTMLMGESPDLQDCRKSIGIEVTAAVRRDDMKAGNAFSKFCQPRNNREKEKCKEIIESSGYSFVLIQGEELAISTTGTSDGEKRFFQENIRKKKEKLQQYRNNFQVMGLAVVLPEIPTSEAEIHFVDWIREVFQENDNLFDFVNVLSHRFCIYFGMYSRGGRC